MVDTIIISGFVGFLLGGIVMAVGVYKTFCEAWDAAWNDGYQYGTETMLIKNANERKEAELFGKEVSGDALLD